jgi:hypothetical protein
VSLDGVCGIDDGLEPAVGGPEVPLLEVPAGLFDAVLLV